MRHFAIAFTACALFSIASGQSAAPQTTRVQLVMLGTETPLPDPERSDRASLSWWTTMPICLTLARASYLGPPQRQGERASQVWNHGNCASPS